MVNKMNRIGQLKIQQMAFMLMAITILFALVGMAFLAFKFSNLKKGASLLEEENALFLVQRLAGSPEFSCGEVFGTLKTNCVDADKVMALKENIDRYSNPNFWGIEDIEIRKIYPLMNGNVMCNRGNYPNCNIIRLLQGEIQGNYVGNFITLCRKSVDSDSSEGFYDKCELAKLMVSYKKK